ncbi:unnamed protein product [Taenia asiatica]|uniref:Uncharacterized protein n=1 Tax=Taenia asiatica TaxID=60517 RepID=A0A0R3WGT2_TAEAS|nr:unnamed protein product [Taenia asiatica]
MCGNTAPSTSRADGREEEKENEEEKKEVKKESSAQVWAKFSFVCTNFGDHHPV